MHDALLISAYDLHREVLVDAAELLSGAPSLYDGPRLLIIDSGGYENLPRFVEQADGTVAPHRTDWSAEQYEDVLGRLPDALDIAIVSFDSYAEQPAYGAQVETANALFARFPDRLGICLLKPPGRDRKLNVRKLSPHLPDLANASVVGVTEKELGDSLRERISTVARLRCALDEAKITAPIHVFGGLDPIMTPLFFAAGAEIFDGLTWLRYGYFAGLSVYQETAALMRDDLESRELVRRHLTELQNLRAMRSLQNALRRLHREGDWSTLYDPARGPGGVLAAPGAYGKHLQEVFKTAMSYTEGM